MEQQARQSRGDIFATLPPSFRFIIPSFILSSLGHLSYVALPHEVPGAPSEERASSAITIVSPRDLLSRQTLEGRNSLGVGHRYGSSRLSRISATFSDHFVTSCTCTTNQLCL